MILSDNSSPDHSGHTTLRPTPRFDKNSSYVVYNQHTVCNNYCGLILPNASVGHFNAIDCTVSTCEENEQETGGSSQDMDVETTGQKNFKCPQCMYITDRKNNLKRHIVTMHQECSRVLECCGVSFRSKSLLREHVSLFHQTGYSCQICGRNFCRKALLRRHTTVHSGQKDFHCPLCNYATSHKSNLERHQKVHTRNGIVQSHRSPTDPCLSLSKPNIHRSGKFRDLRSSLYDGRFMGNCHMQGRHLFSSRLKETNVFSEFGETIHKRDTFSAADIFVDSAPGEVLCFRERDTDPYGHIENDPSDKLMPADTRLIFGPDHVTQDSQNSSYVNSKCDRNLEKHSNNSGRALMDQKSTRKRNRMFAQPYKCPDCRGFFSSQWEVLKHVCPKTQTSPATYSIISVINSHSKMCGKREMSCISELNKVQGTNLSRPSCMLPLKKRAVEISDSSV